MCIYEKFDSENTKKNFKRLTYSNTNKSMFGYDDINNDSYNIRNSISFLPEKINSHNQKEIQIKPSITELQNADTKKQQNFNDKCNLLNESKQNYDDLNYRLLTIKKTNKLNNKIISFINEKSGEKLTRNLYKDNERYLKEPFNRNLVLNEFFNKDDDQESTEDDKEKGASFLLKELDYAILSKRQKNFERDSMYLVI